MSERRIPFAQFCLVSFHLHHSNPCSVLWNTIYNIPRLSSESDLMNWPSSCVYEADSKAMSSPQTHPYHARRGTFIVIEGLDRAGKSTQVELLAKWIAQQRGSQSRVKIRKFPGKIQSLTVACNDELILTLCLFNRSNYSNWSIAQFVPHQSEHLSTSQNGPFALLCQSVGGTGSDSSRSGRRH